MLRFRVNVNARHLLLHTLSLDPARMQHTVYNLNVSPPFSRVNGYYTQRSGFMGSGRIEWETGSLIALIYARV